MYNIICLAEKQEDLSLCLAFVLFIMLDEDFFIWGFFPNNTSPSTTSGKKKDRFDLSGQFLIIL